MYQVVIRLPGLINVLDSYEPLYESRKEIVEEVYISKLKVRYFDSCCISTMQFYSLNF